MKKFLVAILLLFGYCTSYAQTETEPNDDFTTANEVLENENISASIGGGDAEDNFKAEFTYNGNLQIIIEITNTGATPATLQLEVYNGLTMGDNPPILMPQLLTSVIFGTPILPGETISETFQIPCGFAPDDYYFKFTTPDGGTFDYNFEWEPFNVAVIDGNNNSFATARPFTYNVLKEGSLRYEFWGNPYYDSVNYFKSILPAGDYTNRRLYLSAWFGGDCGLDTGWIKYFVFKNDSQVPFASGFIGNDSTVAFLQNVNNSVSLSNMAAGDSLFVKFTSGLEDAFGYNFIYKEAGGFIDQEDNCCITNAINLQEGELVSGNVGEYDYGNSEFIDEFDTYRFTMPHSGSIKIQVAGWNAECTEEYYLLEFYLLDDQGNYLTSYTPLNWENYPACNTQLNDTFKFRGIANGTYYLQLNTDGLPGKINYNFSYTVADSTTRFDVEPNNSTATATPIAPGEVKIGNVNFRRPANSQDANDYYKVVVPADGKLLLNMSSVFLGDEEVGNSSNYKLHVDVIGAATGGVCPGSTPSILQPDSLYTNTNLVCGVGAGTYYLKVYSPNGTPQEYEISYQFVDTSSIVDAEPNNTKQQAILTGGAQTRLGNLNYYYEGVQDNNDYYKFVFGTTDSLVLFVEATNTSCISSGRRIEFSGVNKNNTTLFSRYIANNTNVPDGATIYDTVRLLITAPDTIYVRFFEQSYPSAFKYKMTSKGLPPYSVFTIEGDSAVCMSQQIYKAVNVPENNVTYHWNLPDGGGTITNTDSIATVNWTSAGNRRVQLYLTNAFGSSNTKELNVIVNGIAPTQTPVAYNFARTLSTNSLPPGAGCQWFINGVLIPGAESTSYYAAAAGSYTVKFTNDCGTGPASNAIVFNAAVQSQTISFPHVPNITMSPTAKAALKATSSSGLRVYYQKISGQGTIVNDTLYVTSVGTIIVKAQQPGDDTYSAAAPVFDTITVVKGNQVITFDSIPNQVLDGNIITLTATSSAGVTVNYSIVSGGEYASLNYYNEYLIKKGTGLVTVRAFHDGDGNYNAAVPVDRTFCIGIRTLSPIVGDANPCLNTYQYTTQKIPGAIFEWTLSGGGVLTTHNDTAWVQWQTPGSYTLSVKARGAVCDTTYTETKSLQIITSSNVPGQVTNMIPVDHAVDQQLPLTLSWVPGGNTVNYDLYVWDSTASQPATPFATNITGVNYVIPNTAPLQQNKVYKWRIVSKNPCSQTSGPIQHFKLIPLPDLVVSDVQGPATATSGQTITISWKVTNIGPGNTPPNQSWQDGVYLSIDTFPNFHGSPSWDPTTWNAITAQGRPLLLALKNRPTALNNGEFYTNSVDFTLPINYSFPLYVYVITNNQNPNYPILQVSVANDTARKQDPIIVSLAPTPDLRVDSVFTPSSAFSGSTINVTYKVKNYGVVTPAGGQWVDSFFISQNPLFNRSECLLLTSPKANGSYYPNALGAAVTNTNQLQNDSSVTKSTQVVIPNFIFGTWFIYVKTNANTIANGFVYEGAFSNNNLGQAQMQVYLAPTPKLTVSSITLPVSNASTTQTIGLSWNIRNEGFNDNIEMNKGHIITMGTCNYCPPGSPPNSVCVVPSVIKDSLVYGSSFWKDRVYLSTDSNGLNISNAVMVKEIEHGTQNSGLNSDPPPPNSSYVSCPAIVSGNVNVSNVIKPGSNFPEDRTFVIPSDLMAGTYYAYVYANAAKNVFEYPGNAQVRRSTAIVINRPDVVVSTISVPPSSTGAYPVQINYSVLNNGAGAVFNHTRNDRLYVSNFSSFDGSAQLINTQTYTENLPVGVAVPHSFTHTFPATTSGNKYFYVITNYDSLFRETNYANNLSASALTLVSPAVPSDLVVTSVDPADSVFSVFTSAIKYTVTNNGSGTTLGTWKDSLFISCNPVFNPATSFFIGESTHTGSVPTAASYTDTIFVNMPMAYEFNNCFPVQMYSSAYFFVKTNANNGTYEGGNVGNNVGGSGSNILVNPLVDHIVDSVGGSDTAIVGYPYTTTWINKNIGYKPVVIPNYLYTYYYGYYDGIYFSADSILDVNDARAGYLNLKYDLIERGQELTDSKAPLVPNIATGDYYVIVKTNATNSIPGEKNLNNNTNLIRNPDSSAKKIHVVRPLLPDLTVSIVSAPASVAIGQPITIVYSISNTGTGITFPGGWNNQLRLSRDFLANPNDGDMILMDKRRNIALPAGDSYLDTVTVTIPSYAIPGNYVLLGWANSNGGIIESNADNNLAYHQVQVFTPPLSDLMVQNVMAPDTVMLGYTIDTARWVVKNESANNADGYRSDGIYISTGSILDSGTQLIGIKERQINLSPLASDTVAMMPMVKGVTEGNYNLIVKTDLLNNILEENEGNNTGISSSPIYVKVKGLQLDVEEQNTLTTIERYYKLRIPDSLLGSTILVTLTTPDSLSMHNEIYIGGGYVPTPARYTYAFEIPNYGNQRITISDASDSVFYIMYRCVSPNPVTQTITLKAVRLPFAILNVHTNAGANIGNVTVKINGSLFRDSMVARLSNALDTIYASAVYFTNTTQVYATFNLQGRPLGIYNVTLIKPDLSQATLPNGFSIVKANNGGLITGGGNNTGSGNGNQPGCDPGAASGLNSQLVVDLVVPQRVIVFFPIIIQLHYSNPTNFDIPAQTRILYSEAGMKMALTKAGVPTGTTTLFLELTEQGGPPGIIRAGGSGTILIYSVAPGFVPPGGYVLFKLK